MWEDKAIHTLYEKLKLGNFLCTAPYGEKGRYITYYAEDRLYFVFDTWYHGIFFVEAKSPKDAVEKVQCDELSYLPKEGEESRCDNCKYDYCPQCADENEKTDMSEIKIGNGKGMFIPEVTFEMFRNAPLEVVAEWLAEGEVFDIDLKEELHREKEQAYYKGYEDGRKRVEVSEDCVIREKVISELKRNIDFICEQLAKDFGSPCNFSPIDHIMFAIGNCEKYCRNVPKSECWRRYFMEVQRRSEP